MGKLVAYGYESGMDPLLDLRIIPLLDTLFSNEMFADLDGPQLAQHCGVLQVIRNLHALPSKLHRASCRTRLE